MPATLFAPDTNKKISWALTSVGLGIIALLLLFNAGKLRTHNSAKSMH